MHFRRLAIVVAALSAAAIAPADCAEFYSGKTINLYIGTPAGGGYDLYGRLIARHLGRFVPGTPLVVPQNMPGAGGLRVASYFSQVAPQDGTSLAMASEAAALMQALRDPGVHYDANRFSWIGRIVSSASVFFTSDTSRVKSIEDARRYESTFGTAGSIGLTYYTPKALNTFAGTKFKLVTGYRGPLDILLAMEQGELEGGVALWPEFKKQRPELSRKVNMLYLVSSARAADLPNVPTTEELGQTEDARAILRFLATTTDVGRALFTTPNVPAERVAILRRAFDAMIGDTVFLAEAEKIGARIDATTGEALQKTVAEVVGFPPALVERAKEATK